MSYPYQSSHSHVKIHHVFTEKITWIEKMVLDPQCTFLKNSNISATTLALKQREIVQRWVSQVLYYLMRNDKQFSRRNEDPAYERVKDYVKFTFQCVFYDPIVNVLGLLYFERFLILMENTIDLATFRPYYAVCIMMASKFWEDRFLSNRDYLKDFYDLEIFSDDKKVSLSQWNRYELKILKRLDFNLSVNFEQFLEFLEKYYSLITMDEEDE